MILLKTLLTGAYPELRETAPGSDFSVSGIQCDSRLVKPGDLFIAIRGVQKNGNQFIEEAIKRGAVAIISDQAISAETLPPHIRVSDARLAASKLASVFYGGPSQKLKAVGITGTNGKTTCSYIIEYLLHCQTLRAGVIGTVNCRFAGKEIPANETTPGPIKLQSLLSEMVTAGCHFAVMEVSSHALDQDRASGVEFECALFTNLTQDHLDYHKTMESYFECKTKLFAGLGAEKVSILNVDDLWIRKLIPKLKSKILRYGIKSDADLKAEHCVLDLQKTSFELHSNGQEYAVEMSLLGLHNVYNALGALGVIRAMGLDLKKAVEDLKNFKGVPGRLERMTCGQDFTVFVDFAHTPDGLENVLRAVSPYKKRKLLLVFGCGGDRDRTKRPKMAAIAATYADFIYVTSDNPRSENPKVIAEEIVQGFPQDFGNFAVVLDRAKAIRQALLAARRGDIVLLAGKGHERTQVIGDKATPFSDQMEAEKILHGH